MIQKMGINSDAWNHKERGQDRNEESQGMGKKKIIKSSHRTADCLAYICRCA